MYLNQTKLLGFLGADPEVRTTKNGKEIVSFSIGINKRKKVNGEKIDQVSWFKVLILPEALVSIAKQHMKKGTRALVSGSLRNNKWTDKNNVEHFSTEVVVGDGGLLQFENRHEDKIAA